LLESEVCKTPVDSFLECLIERSGNDWTCDAQGVPLLGHVCEDEQNGVADCIAVNGSL
jgi:hypothetical protein